MAENIARVRSLDPGNCAIAVLMVAQAKKPEAMIAVLNTVSSLAFLEV